MNQISHDTAAVWQRLVESHLAYGSASQDFLRLPDRVGALRQVLRGKDRAIALMLARSLTTDELKQLFSEMLYLSTAAHGPFEPAWRIILSLPREWVIARIEQEAEAILSKEEETDYWMLLQLFIQLNRDLTLRLARRAAAHTDSNIRELGEDYLTRLKQETPDGVIG